MSQRAFIFGAGGHAYVIASFIETEPTFIVTGEAISGQMLDEEFWKRIDDFRSDRILIGIGSNKVRRHVFDRLQNLGINAAVCIAPNAFVARDAEIAPGAVICAGAVVGARAKIGRNTIVNTLSSVDHDCALGEHSQVAAGVTFGGTVVTGADCFFGVKSAVIPNVTIGSEAIVMAGSLVTHDVASSTMVGGSPARVVRSL